MVNELKVYFLFNFLIQNIQIGRSIESLKTYLIDMIGSWLETDLKTF